MSSLPVTNNQNNQQEPDYQRYNLFTDGGCKKPGQVGGWAYILRNMKTLESTVGFGSVASTTNNQMELCAVLEGLVRVPDNSKVLLVSDSEYVVKGINAWLPRWEQSQWRKSGSSKEIENIGLWQELNRQLKRLKSCEAVNVPGHSGHLENELCDRFASQAMEMYDAATPASTEVSE